MKYSLCEDNHLKKSKDKMKSNLLCFFTLPLGEPEGSAKLNYISLIISKIALNH